MLECKKCYISKHDSTAVGLTFVLFGESPRLQTSVGWTEAGWQVGFLRVLFSWFSGGLFRHSRHWEVPKSTVQKHCSAKSILVSLCNKPLPTSEEGKHHIFYSLSHQRLRQHDGTAMYWINTEGIFYFIIYLLEINIKLTAAKHFKDWKYCLQ